MLGIVNRKKAFWNNDNLMIPLSTLNHVLNDESIADAKTIARGFGLSEFIIVQVGPDKQRSILYYGVVSN